MGIVGKGWLDREGVKTPPPGKDVGTPGVEITGGI